MPTLSLPSVSVSGLRAALLGYLGEAEIALRERLGATHNEHNNEYSSASSPSPSSEDDTDYDTFDEHDSPAMTSARQNQGDQVPGLRRRLGPAGSSTDTSNASTSRLTAAANEADAILDSLRTLREDVAAYVPAGFSMPKLPLEAQREWLRALPTRLQDVDLCVDREAWPDPVSASNRAVRSARRRVIDYVHALLPPDDWHGWESLGWEDDDSSVCTPRRPTHTRSCSLDERFARTDEDNEDDDDEPEYLFPNRTPAPAHAFRRHRHDHPRSKSLGEADYADRGSLFTWHLRPEVASVVDDEGDDGSVVDEVLLAEHEANDEVRDCEKHGSHLVPDMGPSIEEAILRSEHGTKLITYQDLPFWWRNNQYLHTG